MDAFTTLLCLCLFMFIINYQVPDFHTYTDAGARPLKGDKGKSYFGNTVLANTYTAATLVELQTPEGKDKFHIRWNIGIYCGHLNESGEILIGTPDGIMKVRTIKRQAGDKEKAMSAVQRASKESLKSFSPCHLR